MKLNTIVIALAAFFLAMPTLLAQDRAVIPNFFDPQDRFQKPDVASLARLRFLTVVDFPPFSYIDGDKQLVGYHVELARALCERLGLADRCEIQALPFGELEAALAKEDGEAIMAGIAMTPESRKRLAFTRPYFRLPARFVAPLGRSLDAALADGMRGKTVAVREKTAHAAFVARFFPNATVVPFNDQVAGLATVKAGKADAYFGDALRLTRMMATPDGLGWGFVGGAYGDPRYFGRGLAIAVRPDDDELLNALNHALVDLNDKRVLEELYLRHFPIGLY